MAENTQPARCTEAEFEAARAAGLLVVTTADEIAIHKFAESVRVAALAAAPAVSAPACQHKRYSLDTQEQVGHCLDCGAEGRMVFVVQAPATVARSE